MKKVKANGSWEEVKRLYITSGQFKTMVDNCMMSMSKSDFRITAYLSKDKKFGAFWKKLKDEYELTRDLTLELTETSVMMEQFPVERRSIALRENIILPLLTIQHYALQKLNSDTLDENQIAIYNKLVIRTVYGIVNAGRNLA